jgi:hypothetical protein
MTKLQRNCEARIGQEIENYWFREHVQDGPKGPFKDTDSGKFDGAMRLCIALTPPIIASIAPLQKDKFEGEATAR